MSPEIRTKCLPGAEKYQDYRYFFLSKFSQKCDTFKQKCVKMQDFPHDCGMVDTYVNALLILYSNSIILLSNASYVGRLRLTDIGGGYSFFDGVQCSFYWLANKHRGPQ